MKRRLAYTAEAEDHLDEIERYIAESSASEITARRYITRVIRFCESLSNAPFRGSTHEHSAPGLRTVGFERRITILFLVEEDAVIVIGVYYGGRQLPGVFR